MAPIRAKPVVPAEEEKPALHEYMAGGANPDEYNWGYNAGKKVSEALEGEKIYAVEFYYQIDSIMSQTIMDGFEAAFDEHEAGYEIIAEAESKSDSLVAAERAQELFLTYPELNAIVCSGGEIGGAVAGVMKEQGIDPSTVIIAADGAMDDNVAAIKDGYVFGSVGQNYFQYGYRPAMWTYMDAVYGELPPEAFADTGTTWITAENCDAFDEGFTDGSQWFKVDFPDYEWPVG